jgi:hypothetical protein
LDGFAALHGITARDLTTPIPTSTPRDILTDDFRATVLQLVASKATPGQLDALDQ